MPADEIGLSLSENDLFAERPISLEWIQ